MVHLKKLLKADPCGVNCVHKPCFCTILLQLLSDVIEDSTGKKNKICKIRMCSHYQIISGGMLACFPLFKINVCGDLLQLFISGLVKMRHTLNFPLKHDV